MTYELTVDEKRNIVNGQMRSVSYRKYNAEVELIVENASTVLNETRISEIGAEIEKCDAQLLALTAELDRLV